MGGNRVESHGSDDNSYDEEGYDESQRAEILEATRDGPSDGVVLTDLDPDIGDEDDEDEPIDELNMDSEAVGETDATVTMDEDDMDEDDVQDELDDGSIDGVVGGAPAFFGGGGGGGGAPAGPTSERTKTTSDVHPTDRNRCGRATPGHGLRFLRVAVQRTRRRGVRLPWTGKARSASLRSVLQR